VLFQAISKDIYVGRDADTYYLGIVSDLITAHLIILDEYVCGEYKVCHFKSWIITTIGSRQIPTVCQEDAGAIFRHLNQINSSKIREKRNYVHVRDQFRVPERPISSAAGTQYHYQKTSH
jgi:hypothetical protein